MSTAILAKRLEVTVKDGGGVKTLLQPQNLSIETGEFVAVLGPSGGGKSVLMKSLYGIFKRDGKVQGDVYLLGHHIDRDFEKIQREIAYVPQYDVIHELLTVQQALFYTAKLRTPSITDKELGELVIRILQELSLVEPEESDDFGKKLIKDLSGGQRKRVNICVELLSNPKIIFLDEPTSPLDPQTIKEFLQALKKLSSSNVTTVMVTHKPGDLAFVDKIVFLGKGGHQCFVGTGDQMLSHFAIAEDTNSQAIDTAQVAEIYSIVSAESKAQKYHHSNFLGSSNTETSKLHVHSQSDRHKESALLQFFWLAHRNLFMRINDLKGFLSIFITPTVIGLIIAVFFTQLNLSVFLLMAVSSIWMGTFNSAKELVDERQIFQREMMFNLKLGSYYFSKLFLQLMISILQTGLFLSIMYLAYNAFNVDPSKSARVSYGAYAVTLLALNLSGSILGLFLSATCKNAEQVLLILPVCLIPQIIFSGVILPLDNPSKRAVASTQVVSWGVENFCFATDSIRINQPVPNKQFSCSQPPALCMVFDPNDKKEEEQLTSSINFLHSLNAQAEEKEHDDRTNYNLKIIALINLLLVLGTLHKLKKTAE